MLQCLKGSVIIIMLYLFSLAALMFHSVVQDLKQEVEALAWTSRLKPGHVVTDRAGQVLRYIPSHNGIRCYPLENEIPEILANAVIHAEDKGFSRHHGVDITAIFRASRDWVRYGKKAGGASTLAMQLVRVIRPRPRTLHSKLVEALHAWLLTDRLGRTGVLAAYLDLVPMGNNIRGMRLKSRIMFNREPEHLDIYRAAMLTSMIKAPGRLSPYGGSIVELRQQAKLLLESWHPETKPEIIKACLADLIIEPWSTPFLAPHAVRQSLAHIRASDASSRPIDALASSDAQVRLATLSAQVRPTSPSPQGRAALSGPQGGPATPSPQSGPASSRPASPSAVAYQNHVHTTIDMHLQRLAQTALNNRKAQLNGLGASQAAVVIMENSNAAIRALVGSSSYSAENNGFVDATLAARSAGSTLKPFLYALALENGYAPFSIIEDFPVSWPTPAGTYSPNNADNRSHGPVTLRQALGSSLNMPAAKILESVGLQPFYELLEQFGLSRGLYWEAPEYYGLGMAIGNIETSLLNLAGAYSALSRDGIYIKPAIIKPGTDRTRVLRPGTAALILHILADKGARTLTFGNPAVFSFSSPVAVKTGTSNQNRDGWCVAITPDWTIAVWAGNFDGSPASKLSGASGPGWIVKDIISQLEGSGLPWRWPEHPQLTTIDICPDSGMQPGPYCKSTKAELAVANTNMPGICTMHGPDKTRRLSVQYAGWLDDIDNRGNPHVWALRDHGPALQYPRITSPLSNAQILSPPDDSQGILFSAQTLSVHGEVIWLINHIETTRTNSPHRFSASLPAGRHIITALGSDGTSDSINITVSSR